MARVKSGEPAHFGGDSITRADTTLIGNHPYFFEDSMSEKFNVGDVLYVVPARDVVVLALRVEEEHVRKTLDGESVTYIASNGSGTVNLDEIKGNIFKTPALCRDFLVSRAIASIDAMIEKAVMTSRERFMLQTVQNRTLEEYSQATDRDGE